MATVISSKVKGSHKEGSLMRASIKDSVLRKRIEWMASEVKRGTPYFDLHSTHGKKKLVIRAYLLKADLSSAIPTDFPGIKIKHFCCFVITSSTKCNDSYTRLYLY
jgi:hypothetical protein